MALQIANPTVVAKIESLAKKTGLTKTAAVERAVDTLLKEESSPEPGSLRNRFNAILAQIDRIPENINPNNPLEWDEYGLPK